MATSNPLNLSFDIGHSSIGWAVLSPQAQDIHPKILGVGVVTFPSDDCLASKRRDLRRPRRHIRSTRQRIERLKRWLAHRGVLPRKELDLPGHPAPFLLAAAALSGVRQLTALELWNTLRWYAHNRGYDGNSRWSRQEEDSKDTEKVKNAKQQLNELGTTTMAHTICKLLDLKPEEVDKKISSFLPYKTLNTAYPRSIITAEVKQLLDLHQDKVPGLDEEACRLIFPDRELTSSEKSLLVKAEIKLPKRYHGGLLFGQLVPRFDNRIISRCPITWAKIYKENIDAKGEKEAYRLAERDAKVPTKKSIEFREYRLARILANLKADGEPICKEARQAIFQKAQNQGRLTHKDLDSLISEYHPESETNVHAYFQLHPDSEDALVFDPVMHELHKARGSRAKLSPFWKFLPASADAEAVELWSKNEPVSLQWTVAQVSGTEHEADLNDEIEKQYKKTKKNFADIDDFCQRTSASVSWPTGRAPFSRPVLRRVKEEVLDGFDSTKACRKTDPEKGEDKPEDGVLYAYSVPDSEINQLLQKRPLAKLTNNPLVRHRLLILERLVDDLITEYTPDDHTQITDITVEVAREVKELSGKTAKEIASELKSRLSDFTAAVTHLEKFAPTLPVTGGLIRKCRIAMDLDWHCPFTGDRYEPMDLPRLELEHIIPFSKRKTNALHALVLTWPEVNRWKGNRTARQFILDEASKPVPKREKLSIQSERNYLDFVKKLKTKGHDDDRKRQRIRKSLLEITTFEEREQGFTEGALTQSSHLIKLAMRSLKIKIPHARLHSIPGIATAEIRKSWDLLGTLGHPEVCGNDAMRWLEKRDRETGDLITEEYEKFPALTSPDLSNKKAVKASTLCPNDECEKALSWPEDSSISQAHCPYCYAILRRVPKPKEDIRSLTHLHHALDALTIGLVTHYFPLSKYGQNQSGKIWKALVSRNRTEEEKQLLRSTRLFQELKRPDKKDPGKTRTDFRLKPLDNKLKSEAIHNLAQGRVVQHIPSNRSGTKAELTTWSIVDFDEASCIILQRPNRGNLERTNEAKGTKWKNVKPSKEALKLLEKHHKNLSARQVSLVKRGILKLTAEPITKVLGPNPTSRKSKLQPHGKGRGAIVIPSNFAIAILHHKLDEKGSPLIVTIPHHKVTDCIQKLVTANNGRPISLMRNGSLFQIPNGKYQGIWKFVTIDRISPFTIKVAKPPEIKFSKTIVLSAALKDGLEILSPSLTGYTSIV
ncbi:MAG: type II CRISPR RNA-guided endonuclease Cas9 [Akkermansiaceae bacterium]